MPADRDEVARRVAILRRFRELLVEQRAKFERYLKVLDRERDDIESGDVDALAAHVELEEQVVSEIFTFQKVIDPLDGLYRAAFAAPTAPPTAAVPAAVQAAAPTGRGGAALGGAVGGPDSDVAALKGSLDELRAEVLRRNQENRELLKKRMELVRKEIQGFRNPLAARKSIYAGQSGGNLVNIEG